MSLTPTVLRTVCVLAAYGLGSIPFGLLIARARGVDIRRVGSGNIGATNVFRCVGRSWGALTFLADGAKGFMAAYVLPRAALPFLGPADAPDGVGLLPLLCAAAAVAGHNWPVWLGFRGGKGVATSVGALLGIAPGAAGVGLAVWIAGLVLTRYVSVASMAAALAVPIHAWWSSSETDRATPTTLTVLGALTLWRHRGNLRRLMNGTEHRFARKTRPAASSPEETEGDRT